MTARAKEKAVAVKRVAAGAGPETSVRVEYNAEVSDQDMGILTYFLNRVEAESNGLKKVMVGAKE